MRNRKTIPALLVALLMIVQLVAMAGAAYTDVADGAWYAGVADKWGYLLSDGGEINPNAPVSRAEFAHVLNSVMKFPAAAPAFSDVAPGSLYSADIGALAAAGVVEGFDGKFAPDATIKRSEAAVMFARAFGMEPQGAPKFNDAAAIPSYVAPYVNTLQECGYFKGDNKGNFAPDSLMTRAEALQVIDNAAVNYVDSANPVTEVVGGNMIVTEPGAVIQDVTVTGNIVISPSVGDGDVTLDNVTLLGSLIVRGGGENSIKIKGNSSIPRLMADKSGKSGVRISVEGDAKVAAVLVVGGQNSVLIQGEVGSVTLNTSDVALVVDGTVGALNIAAPNAAVTVTENAVVTSLYASPEAAGASMQIAGTVESAQIAAPASTLIIAETAVVTSLGVTGSAVGAAVENRGTVETMVVKAADAEVSNTGTITDCAAPAEVTVTGDAPTASTVVEAGSVNDVYTG